VTGFDKYKALRHLANKLVQKRRRVQSAEGQEPTLGVGFEDTPTNNRTALAMLRKQGQE
jgi:hypothetical protein